MDFSHQAIIASEELERLFRQAASGLQFDNLPLNQILINISSYVVQNNHYNPDVPLSIDVIITKYNGYRLSPPIPPSDPPSHPLDLLIKQQNSAKFENQ